MSGTTEQINTSLWGAGIEFAKNSELGILGQYNLNDNISFIGKVRYCTHSKNIYFSPGMKYYFNLQESDIVPYIDIRYGKLHYDLKWSNYYNWYSYGAPGYGYEVVPLSGHQGEHGSTLVNAPALSITGGGEYIVNNYGVNASCGMSYFTKLEDDDDDPENKRTKFFFTIGILYYFGNK